ncbi:four helix bundle protein [Rubritalea squalenifaciens DSM 18772]|uniref:Four helix bundle protein n=1 Tax=Rubritalea squalenifaciens DSM 18772 TaxID=1123071 RepID=A0A1M6EVD5_9BACT|nr:four helix bundle protein [Rubritalea squalenifaciens]SHI89366.1 four helix bundle protein [Rubritalea squalenifaciens DSM 18772]
MDKNTDLANLLREDENHYVTSFRELHVYKKSMELARLIFTLSNQFPSEEKYSLTDQIRRSSRSIGANIAEAWGKRRYPAHFTSKLSDSLSETLETQCWLDHSLQCNYMAADAHKQADELCNFVAAMIRNTSAKSDKFCTSK